MKVSALTYGTLAVVLLAAIPFVSCGSGDSKTGTEVLGASDLRVEETVIKVGDLELKTVLTVPKRAAGELVPGAVIVPTFERLDRHGTFVDPGTKLRFEPYKDLTGQLAERGVATVRYDKRTMLVPGPKIRIPDLTLEDLIPDMLAAFDLLRNTPGVDPERLYFVGHGEGAVLAPAVVESKPDLGVRGLVLIAPPLMAYDQLILAQFDYEIRQTGIMLKHRPDLQQEYGGRMKELEQYRKDYAIAFELLKAGKWEEGFSLNGFLQRYWTHAIPFYGENRERIARLKLPMFIIQGSLDRLVIPQDLSKASQALLATGHIRIERIDPAEHHLISPTTCRVDPRAGELIAAWLKDPVIPPPMTTPAQPSDPATTEDDTD
ncbi:MAG: alpha/beta fold hydrolase [Verrucomicrobia bacterium]|nr:alpha/beta fold hydrolase [Verrucomicrobiota bacterium]